MGAGVSGAGGDLVWVDIETTGLDPTTDSVLEVGLVITDAELQVTATTSRVIAPTRRLLEHAEHVVRDMHDRSGLAHELRDGWGLAKQDVEATLCTWLADRITPRTSPMCGSSVNFDRRFLEEQMPNLAALFHYRMVDVSTIKELVRRWHPDLRMPPRKGAHRALQDIADSIEELRFYRHQFFATPQRGES